MLLFPLKFPNKKRKHPPSQGVSPPPSPPPPAPLIVSIEPQADASYCLITFDQEVSLGGTASTLNINATHGVWDSQANPSALLWQGEDNIGPGEGWSWDSADPSVTPTPDPGQSGTVP